MASRLRQIARQAVRARPIDPRQRNRAMVSRCRKLLAELRKNCPDLLPPDPLPAGKLGATLPIDTKSAKAIFQAAVRPERGETILWRDGENELLVEASKVDLQLADGLAMVSIPVRCDQVRRAVIQVPFALGSSKREAGMIVATEARPRGPVEIVEVWTDMLIAFAWDALLRVAGTLASESGRDRDGAGLIPIALVATANGLQIRTMARHGFDRVAPSTIRPQQTGTKK